jgi:hypothetical protein
MRGSVKFGPIMVPAQWWYHHVISLSSMLTTTVFTCSFLLVFFFPGSLCHGRISDGKRYVGMVADWIGYRAIYV